VCVCGGSFIRPVMANAGWRPGGLVLVGGGGGGGGGFFVWSFVVLLLSCRVVCGVVIVVCL